MEEEEEFLQTRLIFNKYKILRLISKGSFGYVYLCLNIINKTLYAVKIEKKSKATSILEKESFILYTLKGPGIPSIISYGHYGKYNLLIQTLLGKSLEILWRENDKKFNMKDTCMIAIQTLERIEYIHSKFYLHRDIKPGNFLVGNPDSSLIYVIDFGNSRKYRSSRTGKHIINIKTNKIFGTTLFLTLNVLKGNEQSRKDDLESLGYMYIFLATGVLPWSIIKITSIRDALEKTTKVKENTSLEELCKNMPNEMLLYMKYVKNLTFEQNPDYNYLRNLFLSILNKIGEKNDNMFSWVDPSIIVQDNRRRFSSRSNPKMNLFRRIIDSVSKSKNKEDVDTSFDSKTKLNNNKEKQNKENSNIKSDILTKERSENKNNNKINIKIIKNNEEKNLKNEKTSKSYVNENLNFLTKGNNNYNNINNNINNNNNKKKINITNIKKVNILKQKKNNLQKVTPNKKNNLSNSPIICSKKKLKSNKNNFIHKNLDNYNNTEKGINSDVIYKINSTNSEIIYNEDEQINNKLLKNFFKIKEKKNLINITPDKANKNIKYSNVLNNIETSDIIYKRISERIHLNTNGDYNLIKDDDNTPKFKYCNTTERSENTIYKSYNNDIYEHTRNNGQINFMNENKFLGEDINFNKNELDNIEEDFNFFSNNNKKYKRIIKFD